MPANEMPAKNRSIAPLFSTLITQDLKSRKPTSMLNNDQIMLVVEEESPTPRGLANGVGNLFPEIPATKCGTVLAENAPEKKQPTY